MGCVSQSSTLQVLFVSPWSLLVLLWCLVLSFIIIIITMSPLFRRHHGLSCSGDLISHLLGSFQAFKTTNSLWFRLHQWSRDCKRTNNWVHEERMFVVLCCLWLRHTQNFAITVILIDQWFFTGVRKLVKNLCFRICWVVMRFPGSRWSIFISKSTKGTKSTFSSSFIGKTWKKSSSKTV